MSADEKAAQSKHTDEIKLRRGMVEQFGITPSAARDLARSFDRRTRDQQTVQALQFPPVRPKTEVTTSVIHTELPPVSEQSGAAKEGADVPEGFDAIVGYNGYPYYARVYGFLGDPIA